MNKAKNIEVMWTPCKYVNLCWKYAYCIPVEWNICRQRVERLWPPVNRSRWKALNSQWWLFSRMMFISPGDKSSKRPGYKLTSWVTRVLLFLTFLPWLETWEPRCLLWWARMYSSNLSCSRNFSGPRSRWLRTSMWCECSIVSMCKYFLKWKDWLVSVKSYSNIRQCHQLFLGGLQLHCAWN